MPQKILAPLAGRILKVHVAAGASVEEDDEVVIIEALKMETPIYAPCTGVVKEVRVSAGDSVEEDDVLAVIEER